MNTESTKETKASAMPEVRVKVPLFACQECGKKFYTAESANRAAFGDNGCPKCGGSDIDAYYTKGLSQSILEQLKQRQLRAKAELDKSTDAIEALEKNPEVAAVFEKVMRALP